MLIKKTEHICFICNHRAVKINELNLLGLIQSLTYHCDNCGVYFRYPLPEESRVMDYYQSRYFRYPDSIEQEMARVQCEWVLTNLQKCIKSRGERINFIEFGAGRGCLVSAMRKQASVNSAIGFEPDKQSVNWGRSNLDVNLEVGTFHNVCNLEGVVTNGVPLIALVHLLEHLHNPFEVLNLVKRHIGPHYLFLEVPDTQYEGPVMKLNTLSGSSMGQHFWSFSDRSLSMLLKKCGYVIVSMEKNGNTSYWRETLNNFRILDRHCKLKNAWSNDGNIRLRKAFFEYLILASKCLKYFFQNHFVYPRLNRLDLPVIRVLARQD